MNLIPYNQTDVKDKLRCPSPDHIREFQRIVSSYGPFCTVRRTMGEPENFEIFMKLIKFEYETLSKEEQITYIFLAGAKWGVYESAFYARERGILGENEWGRFGDAICRNLVFDKPFWDSQDLRLALSVGKISYGISSGLTPNFKEYVETLCEPDLSQEEAGNSN